MVDYHIHAHSECNAADPDDAPKKVLQVTWRPGGTCSDSVPFEEASFRHLHPDLIKQAADYDKVTLMHPETEVKRVLKDDGKSVEPHTEK
jgi:hypothetical protein